MSIEPRPATSGPTRLDLGLWAGCLAGPFAWAVQLEATYALSPFYCGSRRHLGLHLVTLMCFALVGAGAWAAWREWGVAGRSWPSERDEGTAARGRFLGAIGLLTCLLSAVVIVAQWIAVIVLEPCPL